MTRAKWFKCYPERLLGALAGMGANEQLVYVVVLLRIYDINGPCRDTIEALALRTRLRRDAVARALQHLTEAGRLTMKDGGLHNPVAEAVLEEIRVFSDGRKAAGKRGGLSRSKKLKQFQQNRPSTARAQLKLSHDTRVLSSSSLFPSEDSRGEVDSEERSSGRSRVWDFDQFWMQYPHKVGKGAARKAFDAVMKKTRATFPDVMLGLARYAAKTDDRPWCNPATWLNQERWLDEPAVGGTDGGKGERSLLDAFERISGLVDEAEADAVRDGPVRRLPAGQVR